MGKPVFERNHELFILEEIENNPNATQASIAEKLMAAVGTVNLHIKRLTEKDYIKVQPCEKRKFKYIITPKGNNFKKELKDDYIKKSLSFYRSIRERMSAVLENVRKENHSSIFIEGDGDIYDICKLSCIEKNINILQKPAENSPSLEIDGFDLIYRDPEEKPEKICTH